MTPDRLRFTIRATASRLQKGFIAVPQKFRNWFPSERGKISVAFDDDQGRKALTYHPHDPAGKENRIFGTKEWFSRRTIAPGELISVVVEDPVKHIYRIGLERLIREKHERESRQKLEAATTDQEAERELNALSRLTRKRPRRLARDELLRLAQQSRGERRFRVPLSARGHHETVPAGIRILLRELHDGKCQLCSFTFEKKSGEPYFEIHHLEPSIGHHPSNLLVICPNCHAQLEHAVVTNLERAGIWLVSVTINGKRIVVRQPLLDQAVKAKMLALIIIALFSQIGRALAG